jgi:hypothetical protein
MRISEKFETITADEFGRRIAQAFHDSKSSTALFFIQQAFKDCEDDNGIYWEMFNKMLTRIKSEPLPTEGETKP